MKKVWTYFAIGCVVAIIGMFFSDICGDFFNGMDYGSACVLAHYGYRSKERLKIFAVPIRRGLAG